MEYAKTDFQGKCAMVGHKAAAIFSKVALCGFAPGFSICDKAA